MKRARALPGAADELIAVRKLMPAWIMEGEPYRPDFVLLMDPVSGLVMDVNVFERESSAAVIAAWIAERIGRHPRDAQARRRLRVDDGELASLLPPLLGAQWDVVIAPTPEAAEALASLTASLTAPSGAAGHFADGATPEVVGRFFAAASRLFRAAPWREASDAHVLAVDAPAYGHASACLCIIGALGESFGVVLYRSMEDYLSLLRMAIRRRSVTRPGVHTFAVYFDRSSEVPPRLRQEAKREGWPVERGGFPTVAHIDPDALTRPLGDRDYAFAAALIEALLTFMAKHGEAFAGGALATPAQVRYQDALGAEVIITAPHPHATWEWGGSAEAAALAAGKSAGRRPRKQGASTE